MLTLFKREGSPFWYVRGTVHGEGVYASTKPRYVDGADSRPAREVLQRLIVTAWERRTRTTARARETRR